LGWLKLSLKAEKLNFSFHLLFLVARLHDIHCGIVFFLNGTAKDLP
jgi:hypothetical protein